ncbi:MAG: 30S ribosome-binding factor RbfA [Rhodocyclaceae bacterium]|jgi:ribosome-binding factor A|nr:30S ribosome-binding factor RbfA [Rhodocyclaceae bacterium]
MPKEFSRSSRVVEQIKRELAELIRLELKDPRVKFVTINDVEITPDYAHAKVFFTVLETDKRADIEAGLLRGASFLRRELGKRVRIHTLPQLHFVYDASVEQGARMSKLIEEAVRSDQNQNDDEAK